MKKTSWNRLGKLEIESRIKEYGLQIFESLPEDVNGDKTVNMQDVMAIAVDFGKTF